MEKTVENTIPPRNVSERINHMLRKSWVRNVGIILLLFFIYMCLYMSLFGEQVFVDEIETFQNGYLISKGGTLYKNIISQHMPVSYYIAAVISWFGPHNSYDYRIGFYLIMTTIYIGLYFRHRKYTSPVVLVIGPVFFLLVLPYHSLASSMLSDHWQGIGIGILLLELLRYLKTKNITISTSIWISLGIQLSFGSAFLAAYAILPVMLAVIAIQIWDYFHSPKEDRSKYIKRLIKENSLLVGIVLLPMAVLMLYYLFIGNVTNFIKGAYLINTDIYSKYIGGFGTNPISAAKGPFITFKALFRDTLSAFYHYPFDPLQIITLAMLISNVVVPVWLFFNRQFAAGVAWFLVCILCGIRGFTGFHSLPYFFVSATSVGLIFSWCMNRLFKKRNYVLGITAIVLLSLVANKLPEQLQQTREVIGNIPVNNARKELLDKILDKDDPIHITDVTQMSYVYDYQRSLDFSAAVSTPWTYEAYGAEELKSLQTVKPKVVFYAPGGDTWGFMHDEYGKDLVMYIISNYTQFERSDLWIRNDRFTESMEKLGIKGTNQYLSEGNAPQYINIEEKGICTEYIVPNRDMIILGMGLYTANYMNAAKGTIGLEVRNEQNGKVIYKMTIETTEFKDCAYNRVETESFVLKEGVRYSINIYMENSDAGSLAMALIEDTKQNIGEIEAYSNHEDGEKWDYGIFLIEKKSQSQRRARMQRQRQRFREN